MIILNGWKKPRFKKGVLGFLYEDWTESTTQKQTKNIPYTVRHILLKTNLQWAKEKNTVWKMKMETDESQKSQLKFLYEVFY